MVISNNSQLTLINMKTANHMNLKTLDILDNPKLETIKLVARPKAYSTSLDGLSGSNLRINGNARLKTIDMGEIKEISIDGEHAIKGNPMLKEIKLGSLLKFGATSFDLSGNTALEKFELPQLQEFIIKTTALIKKNKNLKVIGISDKGKTGSLTVRGNPNLPQETLTQLGKIQVSDKKDIQEVGECIIDEVINDFADLDYCQIIDGPVNFTNSTTGATKNNQLVRIGGDVDLAGLCPEQVKFLTNVNINGAIKSDVCSFQLSNHRIASWDCSGTRCAPTTTVSPSSTTENKAAPSGSRNSKEKSPASGKNTDGSSIVGIIYGAIASAVITANYNN